ncbi:hypothetical protein ACA910_002701 [Epithemia clementina (nom. ined.)]
MKLHSSLSYIISWILLHRRLAGASFVPIHDHALDNDNDHHHYDQVSSSSSSSSSSSYEDDFGFVNGLVLIGNALVEDTAAAKNFSKGSTCPLHCRNGGICIKQRTTRTEENPLSVEKDDEWQCLCPEGYAGIFCQVLYDSTTSSWSSSSSRRQLQTQCEGLTCLNGGSCAAGHNYNIEGAVCDCTSAVEVLGTSQPYQFKRFVGPVCEIEVLSDEYCGNNTRYNNTRYQFCVNGGTCRTKAQDFTDRPCSCVHGYTGRHCEYEATEVRSDCPLTCSGAGTCQHGINSQAKKGANKVLGLQYAGSSNFMHCICEDGYAGINCEYDYIKCPDGTNEYCFHGSTCLAGVDICECESEGGFKLAGDYCEFKASDHCDNPKLINKTDETQFFASEYKMKKNSATDKVPFCVNNGLCVQVQNENAYYCQCRENEGARWSGMRCESKVTFGTPPPTVVATDTWPPTASWTVWPTTDLPTPADPVVTSAPIPPSSGGGTFVQCGDLQCENGGTCGAGQNYNTQNALCECSTALVLVGSMYRRFVGRTCEIQVQQENYCPGENGEFCVHGGSCRTNETDFLQKPCECPVQYTGRYCEYEVIHIQDVCLLTCNDHGRCEHGMNPFDDQGANGVLGLEDGGTDNFMHCACDDGYAGFSCDYQFMECGERDRYCFHGSQCVNLSGAGAATAGDTAICECEQAGKRLAGDYCEFEATDYCSNPRDIDQTNAKQKFDENAKMDGATENPFCVNDGICYQVPGTTEYYCKCQENFWTGKRCEIKIASALQATVGPTPAPSEEWFEPFPTDGPTRRPSPRSPQSGSVGVQSESENNGNGDKLSGGGKFGVVLVVLVSAAGIILTAVYFRRRVRLLQEMTYQESDPYTGQDSVFRDKQMDAATTEEQGVDLNQTAITTDTSVDDDLDPNNTSVITAHSDDEEDKDMNNVELV